MSYYSKDAAPTAPRRSSPGRDHRVRRGCSQRLPQWCVPILDVAAKLDRAVLTPRRSNRASGSASARAAEPRGLLRPPSAPTIVSGVQRGFSRYQIRGERDRVLDPDASMAEVPLRFVEQRARRAGHSTPGADDNRRPAPDRSRAPQRCPPPAKASTDPQTSAAPLSTRAAS